MFCKKFYILTSSRVLIINMTIVFFKFQSDNTQIKHFCFLIEGFLFLQEFFKFDEFESVDIKYDNSFSKLHFKNTKFPNLKCFVLHETLSFDKFEGADFKYGNIFSKLLSNNTQIKHLWSKLYLFFFYKTLHFYKFKSFDFKYDNIFFKMASQKSQIRLFWL